MRKEKQGTSENKTGFQPVQEPVKQEVGFFRKKSEISLSQKEYQQTKIKKSDFTGHGYFIVITKCPKSECKKIVPMFNSPKILLCPTTFPSESPKILQGV